VPKILGGDLYGKQTEGIVLGMKFNASFFLGAPISSPREPETQTHAEIGAVGCQ
jgi:hypothetical protein